jgi:hypothetical protein
MVTFKVVKKKSSFLYTFAHIIGKGKAIPVEAWIGPEGPRSLRLPDF